MVRADLDIWQRFNLDLILLSTSHQSRNNLSEWAKANSGSEKVNSGSLIFPPVILIFFLVPYSLGSAKTFFYQENLLWSL